MGVGAAQQRRALIESSLVTVADRIGDPAALVYARLFAAHPAMRSLFDYDKSGAIKGEMLARAFDTLLDFVGDRAFAANFLLAERNNHAGYGVEPRVFLTFFEVVFDALAAEMGDAWSAQTRAAWGGLLADLRAVMDDEARAGP